MEPENINDVFDLLGLPGEIFEHILKFLDLSSLKALSETSNLFFDLTSPTVVNSSWIHIKHQNFLKDIFSSLRTYCNFKIENDVEELDINDRRFRAKNMFINSSLLESNTSLIDYIKKSSTLRNIYVDLGNLEYEEKLQDISNKVNVICYKGYLTINMGDNPYDKFYALMLNYPIEDLFICPSNISNNDTEPLKVDWTKSQCNFKYALKKLTCFYISPKLLKDILQKNSINLNFLKVDSVHFDQEQLPHQLRELCYTGLRDGQEETPKRNSATLENLVRHQRKLETVSIGHVLVTRKVLEELSHNESLRTVIFYGSFLENPTLKDFSCLSRVKKVYLHLSQEQDLKVFYFMLMNFREIESLDIKLPVTERYIKKYFENSDKIYLPKLKKFNCYSEEISKLFIQVICAENLESCNLALSRNFYSTEFLKPLKELGVQSRMTFEDFKEISSHKHIENIFIMLNEFTTDVLEYVFKEVDHLKRLEINFEKWWENRGDNKDKNTIYVENLKLIGQEHEFKVTSNFVQMVLTFQHKNCYMVFRILDYLIF
ncbi:hypothetical protein ACFFRR_006306 [Megaselia abdita]